MEQPGSSMVSGLRPAPVRVILRDDATLREINQTLEQVSANLDKLLDALPDRGGGGDYVP
jgi:hypothetical protein